MAFNVAAGALVGVLGLWASWIVWTWLHFADGVKAARQLMMSGPTEWLTFLHDIAESYQLSISAHLGSHGAGFSPTQMRWLWSIAALMIVLGALIAAAGLTSMEAFSEVSGEWAKRVREGHLELAGSLDEIKAPLALGDLASLRLFELSAPQRHGSDTAWNTLHVQLHSEPDDLSFRC